MRVCPSLRTRVPESIIFCSERADPWMKTHGGTSPPAFHCPSSFEGKSVPRVFRTVRAATRYLYSDCPGAPWPVYTRLRICLGLTEH